MTKRTYESTQIRVYWNSARCIHTAICLKTLPEVFDVQRRPWIAINAAEADEITHAVEQCPTGALAYERLDDAPGEHLHRRPLSFHARMVRYSSKAKWRSVILMAIYSMRVPGWRSAGADTARINHSVISHIVKLDSETFPASAIPRESKRNHPGTSPSPRARLDKTQ